MGQLTGVLALLLSETPVLPLNVSRYTSALMRAVNSLQSINSTATVLSIKIIIFALRSEN
jgi:hypothetical protein